VFGQQQVAPERVVLGAAPRGYHVVRTPDGGVGIRMNGPYGSLSSAQGDFSKRCS